MGAKRRRATVADDRASLLAAVAADPDADLPRLAFADWLDDRGEHDHAEFIRVQCALEPDRDRYDRPGAAALHQREDELRRVAHALAEPVRKLFGSRWWDTEDVLVRRGFPHALGLPVSDLLGGTGDPRIVAPTLRRLRLFWVNGWASQLVAGGRLTGWPELELACWFGEADARALADAPAVRSLRSLTLWLGGQEFAGAVPSAELVQLFASAAGPGLRELVLFDPDGDQGAAELAAEADRLAGRPLARVWVRTDDRVPLAPAFEYFCPGVLPDGRRAVAKPIAGRIHVVPFGPDDRALPGFDQPLPEAVRQAAAGSHALGPDGAVYLYGAPPAVRAEVCRAVGLTPAFLRVLPFDWPDHQDEPRLGRCYHHDDWSVGVPDEPGGTEPYDRPRGFGRQVDWIVGTGQWGCGNGWCDSSGQVHST